MLAYAVSEYMKVKKKSKIEISEINFHIYSQSWMRVPKPFTAEKTVPNELY